MGNTATNNEYGIYLTAQSNYNFIIGNNALNNNVSMGEDSCVGNTFAYNLRYLFTSKISPNPTNKITTIRIFNSTELVSQVLVNITGPGFFAYRIANYQGANQWTCQFNPPSNGLYTVLVNGTDYANNYGYASSSVTIDITAPNISIQSVSQNPDTGIITIIVENTTEPLNPTGIYVQITAPSNNEIYLRLDYRGSNLWRGSFAPSEAGNYLFVANGTDFAGNTGFDSASIEAILPSNGIPGFPLFISLLLIIFLASLFWHAIRDDFRPLWGKRMVANLLRGVSENPPRL
jgi:parallel beta-helix repeat protein